MSGLDVGRKVPRPTAPLVEIGGIPETLKEHDRWVMWRYELSGTKWTKVPWLVSGVRKASSTDKSTWSSYEQAKIAYLTGDFDGIGFVLGDGIAGVDLDDCINGAGLNPDSWQNDVVYSFNTYTEISPSGNGLKLIGFSDYDHSGINKGEIEIYSRERFFTVTGQVYDGLDNLAKITGDHQQLYEEWADQQEPKADGAGITSDKSAPTDDDLALCRRIFDSKQGAKFEKLFAGRHDDYPSQSEADLSLCSILAFWTNKDTAQIDRIFRSSELYRDKWDSKRGSSTYGQDTIAKAIAGTTDTFGRQNEKVLSAHSEQIKPEPEPRLTPAIDPFDTTVPPPFDVQLLPESIRDYAADQGALMGADPGMIGLACLGVIAGCADDRIMVQPKRYDPGWTESARIWPLFVGDPSVLKTPAIQKATGAMNVVDREWRLESQKLEREHRELCAELKKQKADEFPDPPQVKRLSFGDVTVEKLAEQLSRMEPRGVLIFRDEISAWLYSMDAYKSNGGKDRGDWLAAYNGGPHQVDRIRRGSIWIDNWSCSVIGGVQPSVIKKYAEVTDYDGMIQRFLVYLAQAAGAGEDRPPDKAAKDGYFALVREITEMRPPAYETVRFAEDAHEVRENFEKKVRDAMVVPNHHLVAMMGKWLGLFPRMALTYHIVECVRQKIHPVNQEISRKTVEMVYELLWGHMLKHGVSFYEEMDPSDDDARDLAGLILARGWKRFTVKRDLNNYMKRSRKMDMHEKREMLDRLQMYRWIKREDGAKIGSNGLPVAFEVNPSVHIQFTQKAEQERQRREKTREFLNELKM